MDAEYSIEHWRLFLIATAMEIWNPRIMLFTYEAQTANISIRII
jgi:hypothetical protein